MSEADNRALAQFFFDHGFTACWADAMMANAQRPVFDLTDARFERAWAIMPECCDTPEDAAEFAQKKALADAAPQLLAIALRLIKWDKDFPVNCHNGYAGLKELDAIIADAAKATGRLPGGAEHNGSPEAL